MTEPQFTPNLGVVITNPDVRKRIYGAYVLVVLAATATQVGFSAVQAGQPLWLTATMAVLAFLGVPIGGLAAANTGTART